MCWRWRRPHLAPPEKTLRRAGGSQINDQVADRDSTANGLGAASTAETANGRFWIGKSVLPSLALVTQLKRRIVSGVKSNHAKCCQLVRRLASHAAIVHPRGMLWARLVFDHSSSMSHFTSSSIFAILACRYRQQVRGGGHWGRRSKSI